MVAELSMLQLNPQKDVRSDNLSRLGVAAEKHTRK